MSIVKPLKGADISSNNPRISIPELVQKNYHYLALRVTGGWDGRSGPFMDPDYKARQNQLDKQPSLVNIAYGFPIADHYADLDLQIDRFVHTVGNFDNKIPAIDYEKYTPEPKATPSPAECRYYTRGIQKLIGPMPTLMYAGLLFWMEAPSSGDLELYGAHLKQWVPKYRTTNTLEANPMTHYLKWLAVMGWWKKFGGRDDDPRPEIAQIGIFNEAGGPLDVNMARVSKETLRKWEGHSGEVVRPSPRPADGLPDYARNPLAYLERCVGGKYTPWKSSDGKFADGPPAWAANANPPLPPRVKDRGSFCAGPANLAARVNGLRIFQDTSWWYGGVPWWANRLIDRKDVAQRFTLDRNYPPGTLFIRRFTGNALADQGHLSIMGRHGKLLQADFFGDGRDGINENRTLRETHGLLQRFDGGGFEYFVRPEDWLR